MLVLQPSGADPDIRGGLFLYMQCQPTLSDATPPPSMI